MTSALVWLLAVAAKVDLKLFLRRGLRGVSPLEIARGIRVHMECIAVLLAAGAT